MMLFWYIAVVAIVVAAWMGWVHARIDELEERLRIHVRRTAAGDDDDK